MNKVKYFNEQMIRNKFDVPTNKMLSLWHVLSKQKYGNNIDVVMVDNKDVPATSQFKGDLYTAFPTNTFIKDNVVLVVVVNTFENLNQLLVSHEIGHWVLKMQGFVGFSYNSDTRNNQSIFFNSMLQHPAIYQLQTSFGHKPISEINNRLRHHIEIYSKEVEKSQRDDRILSAFLVADDLINTSSKTFKVNLKNILEKKHPSTLKLVDVILETSSYYNLTDPNSNYKFACRLIKNLKIQTSLWQEVDNVKILANMFNEKV